MRQLFIIFLLIIVLHYYEGYAQKSELSNPAFIESIKQDSVAPVFKYETGLEVGTSFMTDLKGGYGIEKYISPKISFYPSKSWQMNFNATLGSVSFRDMTLFDYYYSPRRITGIGHYIGVAGQGVYKVNEKVYLSTDGYAEKIPDVAPLSVIPPNRINYGGSLNVGYKFSEKVSIQAGVGIHKFNDPWGKNPRMFNDGFIP